MKNKIDSKRKKEFDDVLDKVKESKYFVINNIEKDNTPLEDKPEENSNINDVEVLEYWQSEAIKDYGSFLSLVPKEAYPQVAFDLLKSVYYLNLSRSESRYEFSSFKFKTEEKRAVETDLKIAKKYRETIKNCPSLELKELVDLNISDLENYIKNRTKEAKRNREDIIKLHTYKTLEMYKYDKYNKGDKFTKQGIIYTLNNIVERYNIIGYSKEIKRLIDEL